MSSNAIPLLLPARPQRVRALEGRIDGQTIAVMAPPRGVVQRVLAAKDLLVERGDLLVELDRGVQVLAPVAGRLIGFDVAPGDVVDRSRALATILYSNDLWVLARFGPEEFSRLQPGQHAQVHTGGLVLAGRVGGMIGPGDPVLLDLVGWHRASLRPGMSAAVQVEVG